MTKYFLGCLAAALALFAGDATGGHISPCLSTVEGAGGVLVVCPAGDGPTLADIGSAISVTVHDSADHPVPGIPATDFWIAPIAPGITLCNGHLSCNADAATDALGRTTISGTVAAGGYHGHGAYVIAQGMPLRAYECDSPLPLVLVSPDINDDGVIDLYDLAEFAAEFPNGTDPRMDFNGDGTVNALDFRVFGNHYTHHCEAL